MMHARIFLFKCIKFTRSLRLSLVAVICFCTLLLLNSLHVPVKSSQVILDASTIACSDFAPVITFPSRSPDCAKILNGDLAESCLWVHWHAPIVNESVIEKKAEQCDTYRQQFNSEPASDEEARFPLAFSIGMHRDVEQFERLLRMIYWPQNVYCVHVDRKASESVHRAVRAIAKCLGNVMVTSSEYVYWGGFGVLKASLNCAADLLHSVVDWRYMINLAAQDVPLKTNREMVSIFTILNGTNDVEMLPEMHFKRYFYSHIVSRDENGVPFTHRPDYQSNKLPVPHSLRMFKGNFAASLSKQFVSFLFKDERVLNFVKWLEDTDTADEHLWSTINHNAVLNAPGGYKGNCRKAWITRTVDWATDEKTVCHGKFVRDVCVHGVIDLPTLIKRPNLFANKFYLDYQSAAFYCMEHYIRERTKDTANKLELDYYRSLNAALRAGSSDSQCDHQAFNSRASIKGAANAIF
uniref:Beta-1,3-galactosyl-O-glycosyl-glycoprotein beta-1,6-N-acetylglucosaminyltransferase n=1 Tax=Plectus sambesii TaxID=2011161 RepID=A0A914V573_9BILA